MNKDYFSYNGYIPYLYNTVKKLPVTEKVDRLVKLSKPFFIIRRIAKVLVGIITFIETSAFLLLCATVLLIALPAILALALIFYVAGIYSGKKFVKRNSNRFSDKNITVFANAGKYGKGFANELAQNPDNTVILISSSLNKSGISGKNVGELLYVRPSLFFRLKKQFFNAVPEKITFLE